MIKRILLLLLCAAVFMTAGGCAALVEGEFVAIDEHIATSEEPVEDDIRPVEVKNYAELSDALLQLVMDYESYGLIRFSTYEGEVEEDVSNACMDVSNNTPMGAYAVYYMSSTVNKIVSYYEAEIYISYKKSSTAINSVKSIRTPQAFKRELSTIMNQYGTNFAVLTDTDEISEEFVAQAVEEIYYSNPECSIYLPSVSVNFYPEDADKHIVDITLEYPYIYSRLSSRERASVSAARRILEAVADLKDGDALLTLCEELSAAVTYNHELEDANNYDRWQSAHTVYGALVEGTASSEGIALSYKLLCDRRGIECYVVTGRYNNMIHAWNIVKLGEDYYHVDVAFLEEKGLRTVFLRSDEDMADEYWWDTGAYAVCNGPLTSYDITGYGPVN